MVRDSKMDDHYFKFEFTVMRCIFQNTDTFKYPIGWMVIFSSLVYKKLILKDWKGSEAPSLQLWKGLMKYYLSIERSMFEDRNRRRQFNKVWQDMKSCTFKSQERE